MLRVIYWPLRGARTTEDDQEVQYHRPCPLVLTVLFKMLPRHASSFCLGLSLKSSRRLRERSNRGRRKIGTELNQMTRIRHNKSRLQRVR